MEMSMVAEGYYAAKSAWELNQKYQAKTPIIDAVHEILYEGKEAKKVFKKLDVKLTLGDLLAQDQAFYMDLNDNKKYDIDSDNTVFNYTFGRNISLGLSLKF